MSAGDHTHRADSMTTQLSAERSLHTTTLTHMVTHSAAGAPNGTIIGCSVDRKHQILELTHGEIRRVPIHSPFTNLFSISSQPFHRRLKERGTLAPWGRTGGPAIRGKFPRVPSGADTSSLPAFIARVRRVSDTALGHRRPRHDQDGRARCPSLGKFQIVARPDGRPAIT